MDNESKQKMEFLADVPESPERSQPEYIKLAGEFFAENPAVLAQVQSLLDKLFKYRNVGQTRWGDIAPDTFRKQFSALIPEPIRKAYRKEITGKDAINFAEFAKNLISQAQGYSAGKQKPEISEPIEVSTPNTAVEVGMDKQQGLPARTPEDNATIVQNKIAWEREKQEQVLSIILPEFEKDKAVYASSKKIFEVAKEFGVLPRLAVKFLYHHYGLDKEFNELKTKNLVEEKEVSPLYETKEQALLRKLVDLTRPTIGFKDLGGSPSEPEKVEKVESEESKNYFITMPYANKQRVLLFNQQLFDRSGNPEKIERFSVMLPLTADIGKGEELYKLAFSLLRKGRLSDKEFAKVWSEQQTPDEKHRIAERTTFINTAKPLFDAKPIEFITKNKLPEFALGIPNEQAINYLADESLIGEARIKQYRQFQDFKNQPDSVLAEFIDLSPEQTKKLNREQLLLAVLAKLVEQAKADAQRRKAEKEAGKRLESQGQIFDTDDEAEQQGTPVPEIITASHAELPVEPESSEKYENHPIIQAAKEAGLQQFLSDYLETEPDEQKRKKMFQSYWEISYRDKVVELLKKEGHI